MSDLSITTTINIAATHTKSLDLNTVKDILDETYTVTLTDGTGSSQADVLWHDKRQIAASSSDTLVLAATLTNAFGDTATFVDVKGLVIKNLSTTRTLTVGNAAASCWVGPFGAAAHTIDIQPQEPKVLVNSPLSGYAVVASSADQLKIANNSASSIACSYNIIIWGTSA